MGLELPSHSLGYAHLGLLTLLTVLAVWRPSPTVRLTILGAGFLLTLILPVVWVGPAWESPPENRRFAWGFFLTFGLSLAIPYMSGTTAVTLLARRREQPGLASRLLWPITAYLLGLAASFPVSFNYALAYIFLR